MITKLIVSHSEVSAMLTVDDYNAGCFVVGLKIGKSLLFLAGHSEALSVPSRACRDKCMQV